MKSFDEWLMENDPELNEGWGDWARSAALGGAVLGATMGGFGGQTANAASPNQPVAVSPDIQMKAYRVAQTKEIALANAYFKAVYGVNPNMSELGQVPKGEGRLKENPTQSVVDIRNGVKGDNWETVVAYYVGNLKPLKQVNVNNDNIRVQGNWVYVRGVAPLK
jgi:hypothetical protein